MSTLEFNLFLPQMRMSMGDLVDRALVAEGAGFQGISFMDHLSPPMASGHPMYEAMTTAAWVGARTTTLGLGHLVLCDGFREPALLASQAATLHDASGGRFELGIGWGSVPEELTGFGISDDGPPARVARLSETLDVVRGLWSGESFDYDGDFHRVEGMIQAPAPGDAIPIVIGGAGPKTLRLVAAHADWWNCPIYALDRFDALRDQVGAAKPSVQQMVCFVHDESRRSEITGLATKRFGQMGDGLVIGDASELVDQFGELSARGVARIYAWMTDFAHPETLEQFGTEVVSQFSSD